MSTDLLKIDNLIVGFEQPAGELTAVKGVSLEVAAGETLALVGESGCGKTVLCKSMLKLLCDRGRIRQGRILLEDRDLAPVGEREMTRYRGREIAMVFQDPMTALDPAFSVGEQIAEALRIHRGLSTRDAKEAATALMEQVQIPHAKSRYHQRPYQFSGGMRQRIVIAIALAGKPKLLLADEPTTALDEETQREILQLLKEVQRETGVGMLFITHDLSLVEDIAHRVAIMQDGLLVEQGEVAEVFRNPRHPYTKKLLGYLDYRTGRGHHHRGRSRTEAAGPAEIADARPPPLLQIRNLSKAYGLDKSRINRVLTGFHLDIQPGEIVGLVGKSGCGKSTLARCIMGLEKPDAGSIRFREGIRAQMIFQDSQAAFNDRMTVEEIIGEPLALAGNRPRGQHPRYRLHSEGLESELQARRSRRFHGKKARHQAILHMMRQVELDPSLAGRKPYQLSGGQRQRVAIARALITQPDFLVADEPLTGLDVSAQAQIVHLLKRLAEERGLTVLLIAHDLPMVNHISDRVVEVERFL